MAARTAAAVVLLAVAGSTWVSPQSLEEAAAREAARRRQARGGRTYTNSDLPTSTAEEPAASGAAPAKAAGAPTARPKESAEAEPSPPPSKSRTEAEWKQVMASAREAVVTAKARLKTAEAKKEGAAQALGTATALANQGKPTALLVVLEESADAEKEFEEAKTALATAESGLAGLTAEATELGVPDSWWAEPQSS